jgi:hypothetical protein
MAGANKPKTLTTLCFVSNLTVEQRFSLKATFSKRYKRRKRREISVCESTWKTEGHLMAGRSRYIKHRGS